MLKKETILEKAAVVVMNSGYQNTRLEDIANEIGVTRPNLYYHFKNKEDLMMQLLEWLEEEYYDKFLAPALSVEDPIDSILILVDRFTDEMRSSRCKGGCIIGLLAQELSNSNEAFRVRIANLFDAVINSISDRFTVAKENGYFNTSFNPRESANNVVLTLQGAMLLAKSQRDIGYMINCRAYLYNSLKYWKKSQSTSW